MAITAFGTPHAAGALWYGDGYKNLLTVLAQSPNVARVWLYIGFAFLAANLGIFLYLTVWLGAVCGVKEEWEVSSPWSIPAATGTGLSAGLMLTIALWPVWSFATPVVLLVLFMGMVMSQHFVPSFGKRKTEKVD
ncbi:hypothetical protein WJX72_001078 [[Myrmecia] bisecta]|uniref:Uncharacterized protein n=1 Tax=[Myrmecia] bisecta TaxID=41462 RepID=A0AAW1R4M7_9CHLO